MKIRSMSNNFNLKNDKSIHFEILLFLSFLLIGTLSRTILVGWNLQPFPNFEIIMLITFLASIFLRPTLAISIPLFSMIFSDLFLGNSIFVGNQMNRIILFTYSGFALIALVNIFNKKIFVKSLGNMRIKNIGLAAGLGIGFVLIYDVWTNIGWWYLIYPHTMESLIAVFTAGIPFMIYHMLSGAFTFSVIALPIISYFKMENKIQIPIKIKNEYKIPVAALVVFLIIFSFSGTGMQIPEKSEIWLEESDDTSLKMVIIGDGWRIQDNIIPYEDDTVFSILEKITNNNDISFEYMYYDQFDSILIKSINNDINGINDMYWQYYVNGEIPTIGCDKYFDISNGDFIEWRFEVILY